MIVVHVEHFLNDEGKAFFPKWLDDVEKRLQSHRGFLSLRRLERVDHPDGCHLLLRFESLDLLKKWSSSEDHSHLLERLAPFRVQKHISEIYIEKPVRE